MVNNYKSFSINDNSFVVSGVNTYFHYMYKCMISLGWNLNDANEFKTMAGAGGDATMANYSILTDENLVFSAGWGDGFAIRRMEDNGDLTVIYHDNVPMNSYSNMNAITVDIEKKIVYVGSYASSGIARYDYSGCLNGGTTVVKLSQLGEGNGLYSDQPGDAYVNGMVARNGFLYIAPYERSTSSWLQQYNTETGTSINIPVNNYQAAGRYGQIHRDDEANRIYITWRSSGGIWLIENPDKAGNDPVSPCKIYDIKMSAATGATTCYTNGVIADKNNHNHLWVFNNYGRAAKIDITPILEGTGTNPILLQYNPYKRTTQNNMGPFWMSGYNAIVAHPVHGSDLLVITPDRDWYMTYGWWDQENGVPVGDPRWYDYGHWRNSTNTAYTWRANDSLNFSYAPQPVLATSANGTKYWIVSGYSYDGYAFRVWRHSDFPNGMELETSGNIVFGTFSLDNNANIGTIKIEDLGYYTYIPSGTTFQVYVSNNNGASWETYDFANESIHQFNTTGYQARVKLVFQGTGTKCPHVNGMYYPRVIIAEKDTVARNVYVKKARLRIKGR